MKEYILKENLIVALAIAIDVQQNKEKQAGYTNKSAFLAGIEDSLKELKENNLYIRY